LKNQIDENLPVVEVSRQMRGRYQSQLDVDCVFVCSNGDIKASIFAVYPSDFFRGKVEILYRNRSFPLIIDCKGFQKSVVKIFTDLLHGIEPNNIKLNQMMELIEFLLDDFKTDPKHKNISEFESRLLDSCCSKLTPETISDLDMPHVLILLASYNHTVTDCAIKRLMSSDSKYLTLLEKFLVNTFFGYKEVGKLFERIKNDKINWIKKNGELVMQLINNPTSISPSPYRETVAALNPETAEFITNQHRDQSTVNRQTTVNRQSHAGQMGSNRPTQLDGELYKFKKHRFYSLTYARSELNLKNLRHKEAVYFGSKWMKNDNFYDLNFGIHRLAIPKSGKYQLILQSCGKGESKGVRITFTQEFLQGANIQFFIQNGIFLFTEANVLLAVAGSAGISDGQAVTRCDSPRVSVATSSAPAMNGLKETSGSLDPSRNEFQSHFTQPVKSYNKGYDFPDVLSKRTDFSPKCGDGYLAGNRQDGFGNFEGGTSMVTDKTAKVEHITGHSFFEISFLQ